MAKSVSFCALVQIICASTALIKRGPSRSNLIASQTAALTAGGFPLEELVPRKMATKTFKTS